MTPFLLLAESAAKECRFCECMKSPLCWAIVSGALGLWLLLPRTCCRASRIIGICLGLASLGLFGAGLPLVERSLVPQFLFWVLAGVTIGSAATAIVMQSPVYTTIWFAFSLVGTAGLFLYQGAQFLAVATIVVYAGAIVVTFLFVIMLAQPEGHANYDRISWGLLPKPLSVFASAAIVGLLTFALGMQTRAAREQADSREESRVADRQQTVLNQEHLAGLGKELFGSHLLSVEVAGTLLLVALVGAVAIVIHGKETEGSPGRDRHE